MAQNLEIKIKVENLKQITNLIEQLGAVYSELLKQKDTYYKNDAGLLKLRNTNREFQLIKYNRDEINPDRWSDYELLFITGDNVEDYLASLFEIEAIVEKERELYLFNNTRIHLDNVKGLGQFLELETVVRTSQEEAKTEFEKVLAALKIDINKQIKTSYRYLIEKK